MTDEEIIAQVAKTNELDYTLLKTAEECTELSDVLIKMVTKKGGPKEPSRAALVEEIGDVVIRLAVLNQSLDLDYEIEKRVEYKLSKFESYLKDGKYKGKI